MNCKSCQNWEIIPTNNSEKGDFGLLAHGYRNCLENLKVKDEFAKFKFVHETYTCEKWVKK